MREQLLYSAPPASSPPISILSILSFIYIYGIDRHRRTPIKIIFLFFFFPNSYHVHILYLFRHTYIKTYLQRTISRPDPSFAYLFVLLYNLTNIQPFFLYSVFILPLFLYFQSLLSVRIMTDSISIFKVIIFLFFF